MLVYKTEINKNYIIVNPYDCLAMMKNKVVVDGIKIMFSEEWEKTLGKKLYIYLRLFWGAVSPLEHNLVCLYNYRHATHHLIS